MKNKLIRTTKNPDLETKRYQKYIVGVANALANNTIIPQIPNHSVAYSTTEHVVGTWIDGSPLYEKVINFGALPNSTQKQVQHGISNINLVTSISGITQGINIWRPIPYVSPLNIEQNIAISVTTSAITITTNAAQSNYTTTYIIIQYTKSTSSKIITTDEYIKEVDTPSEDFVKENK